MDTFHLTATWTANGTANSTIERQTHHDYPYIPDVITAAKDRLTMGAVVVEVKRIQTRRQAEKESV